METKLHIHGTHYYFWCPGCKQAHSFSVREKPPHWTFDGNMILPTFSPSLLYPDKKPRCHLFLEKGMIRFLGDCEHTLAGKTVEMEPFPKEFE